MDGNPRDAEEILPEEMWELILKNVPHLYNCFNTCKLWQSILIGSRTTWLFSEVLPSLHHYLSRQDLLNCRRVCTEWTSAIDNFLPSLSSKMEWNTFPWASLDTNKLWTSNPIYSTEVNKWLHNEYWKDWLEMKSHKRNPLIGRALRIEDSLREGAAFDEWAVWEETSELLQSLGRHLHYLAISFFEFHPSSPELLPNFLSFCLQNSPNLKGIFILGISGGELLKDDLPQLKYLEKMKINVKVISPLVSLMVKKYSKQLTDFEVFSWNKKFGNEWPNLTNLCVQRTTLEKTLDLFLSLDCPQLKRLSLGLDFKGGYELNKIIKIIQTFPSLETFRLRIQIRNNTRVNYNHEVLALSSLGIFDMNYSPVIPYSFLQHFTNLRELHLEKSRFWGSFAESGKVIREETVKVHGPLDRGDLTKSNIWEVIPSLKIITVKSWSAQDVYLKKKWERQNKDKQRSRSVIKSRKVNFKGIDWASFAWRCFDFI